MGIAFLVVAVGPAAAQNQVGDVYCNTGVATGIDLVFGAIAGLGLPATAFYIGTAGLSYMRAGGNPEKKNDAKEKLGTSQSRLVRTSCLLKVCPPKPNKQTVRSTRTSFLTLVNRLDEEVSLSLANNAEITAEDIYHGVLVGACADGTLCLYALCVEPELTRWEHGPLPSSDEVRAGTARTSR